MCAKQAGSDVAKPGQFKVVLEVAPVAASVGEVLGFKSGDVGFPSGVPTPDLARSGVGTPLGKPTSPLLNPKTSPTEAATGATSRTTLNCPGLATSLPACLAHIAIAPGMAH